jgi:hypothetical protein
MWHLRRQVSLLVAEGHVQAAHYPVGMVFDEAQLVVERLNRAEATRAVLLQMAVSAVLTKEAGEKFNERIALLMKG